MTRRGRRLMKKKERRVLQHTRRSTSGQSSDGIIASRDTIKVFAPVGSSSSYRGCLLSTVQPVDEQGHYDASHGLRGGIQQELHHRHHLLSEGCPALSLPEKRRLVTRCFPHKAGLDAPERKPYEEKRAASAATHPPPCANPAPPQTRLDV